MTTSPLFPDPMKSVHAPITGSHDSADAITIPPRNGARLQTVYDHEARYMRLMRAGEADAIGYDWVPELSLSVSAREAARLGDITSFAREPVAIRGTGGTVVPQGPGTINISVLSRHPRHPGIHKTYAALCDALMTGFTTMGLHTAIGARPGSFCDGDHNILLTEAGALPRKLVGTAQRWSVARDGSAICLHHCVVLSGGDPEDLCGRAEALYRHAGMDVHYDRNAHSGVEIERSVLAQAMDKPLRDYIVRAHDDRL